MIETTKSFVIYLNSLFEILFAKRLGLAGLKHVPHAHIVVRVLGHYESLVVQYMILFDAGRAANRHQRLSIERTSSIIVNGIVSV